MNSVMEERSQLGSISSVTMVLTFNSFICLTVILFLLTFSGTSS